MTTTLRPRCGTAWASLLALFVVGGGACDDAPKGRKVGQLYQEARNALRLGDVERAVRLLEQVVERAPRRVDGRLTLTRAYLRAGKLPQAEKNIRVGLALRPQSAPLWLALGRVLRKRGKRDGAIEALSKALELDPGLSTASFQLAEIYEGHNKLDVAASHYQAILARPKFRADRVRAHRRLAGLARRRRRFGSAVRHLKAALEIAPRNPDLLRELAGALRRGGRAREALAPLRLAARVAPRDGRVQVMLGLTLHEVGKQREAVRALRVGAAARPKDLEAQLALARSLLATGDRDAAYQAGVRAIGLGPEDHRAQWLMVPLYVERELWAPAKDLLDKLAAVRSHDARFWSLRGDVATGLGRHRAAYEAYARALTLRGRDAALQRKTAFAARRAGVYAAALRHLGEVIKRNPKDYDALIHRAISREQLGRRALAGADLSAAEKLAPKRPAVAVYRAWIALRAKQYRTARREAARADRLATGKSAHALDVLAEAHLQLGEKDLAKGVLRRALRLPRLSAKRRAYFVGKLGELDPVTRQP